MGTCYRQTTERNMDLGFSTAKAATVIRRLKEEANGPVIQIENGDFIQGALFKLLCSLNKIQK